MEAKPDNKRMNRRPQISLSNPSSAITNDPSQVSRKMANLSLNTEPKIGCKVKTKLNENSRSFKPKGLRKPDTRVTIQEEKNEESDHSGSEDSSSDDEDTSAIFGNKVALRKKTHSKANSKASESHFKIKIIKDELLEAFGTWVQQSTGK